MTDLIEKVARRIDGCVEEEFFRADDGVMESCICEVSIKTAAKAAIQTVLREMMEPTDAMVCEAECADVEASEKNLDEGGPGRGLDTQDIWKVMVLTFAQQHSIELGEEDGENS